MTERRAFERLSVILDPRSPDGESGAGLARSLVGRDGHIQLAVALSGPEAQPLRDHADSEVLTVKTAAEIYMAQAVERLAHRRVSTTLVDGTDLTDDLVHMVKKSASGGVVIPASMAGRAIDEKGAWEAMNIAVLVVPAGRR